MNTSAYRTTGLAIKTLSRLSKADIMLHGEEKVPEGPTIFVINHFTRIETFLLPYYIYNLTEKPVWSLASAELFTGGLGKFLDLVGTISTKNPDRDKVILKSLLTGEANWIIFPEGRMVKNKKIMSQGKFMITASSGTHQPHTGAASFGLRSELLRNALFEKQDQPEFVEHVLGQLGIESFDLVRQTSTAIVPVNLTYYPIRARDNIASSLATKMVKDIPERMLEEIMTEGTMLLSGVDLDIRFGSPIPIAQCLLDATGAALFAQQKNGKDIIKPVFGGEFQEKAEDIMQLYMERIYSMTTLNHEHLFASMLRLHPFHKIRIKDLQRRVYYATLLLKDLPASNVYLHHALKEEQTHLVVDDRYGKFDSFLQLALDKGVLRKENDMLIKVSKKLSPPVSFHRGRIDNPLEIIANEAEPLVRLQKMLRTLAWQPDFVSRLSLAWYLIRREERSLVTAFQEFGKKEDSKRVESSKPLLLRGTTKRMGVLLVHSYLSSPQEVQAMAEHFNRMGLWVYSPRLAGHGTSSVDLAGRSYGEWQNSVEVGYTILKNLCCKVVLGGISVGGSLVFDLASRAEDVSGLFAVCPPLKLQDYSTKFMPATDVWNRILGRMKRENLEDQFFSFASENPHVNYRLNPYQGIREVGRLLDQVQQQYKNITQPALILQADKDAIVTPKGAQEIYDSLASTQKEFSLFSSQSHVPVSGMAAKQVTRTIEGFLKGLL